jgi:membrane-associated phospholipid phosphatase
MAAANVEVTPMPGWTRRSLQAGLYGVAAATGWARVEAGVHYPTDVLVGYAIGQFIARFGYHAFLYARPGVADANAVSLEYTPLSHGAALTVSIRPGGL